MDQVQYTLYLNYILIFYNLFSFYVSALRFSNKDGSVLVTASLAFKSSQTNPVILKELFKLALADGTEINGLKINPKVPIGKQC